MGCGIEPRKIRYRRGRGFSFARRQHVRHRHARGCRPAGVEGHITCKGIASCRRANPMKRREFITLLGASAAAWPLAARAQQPAGKLPKIGSIQNFRNENFEAFIQGLREAGYMDGQNVLLETRFYSGAIDRIDEIARDLVALKCSVILATAPYAIRAVMNVTSTIPIVGIDLESDPVASGWASSLARPGRNLTGLFLDIPELGGK